MCGAGRADGRSSGQSFTPVVLPNGAMVLCCMDYGLQHVLGNLVQQTYDEIVYSDEYVRVEKAMDDDTIPLLCRSCATAWDKSASRKKSIYNLLVGNAIKVGRYLGQVHKGKKDASLPSSAEALLEKIDSARYICVFGLGKLFNDGYFESSWHDVLQADFLSDNDSGKWGKEFGGIFCVAPDNLRNYDGLLVVTWVREDGEIKESLKQKGISNVINAYEIFNVFD